MSKSPRKNRFAVSMMSLLTASGGQSRGLHGGLLGLCASGLCGVGLLGMGGMGASLGWAADWAQFRGGPRLSHVESPVPAAEFLKSKEPAWRVELPGAGLSQPIVFGDAIYLTTATGGDLPKLKGMQGVMDPSTMGRPSRPKQPVEFQLLKLNPQDGSVLFTKTVARQVPNQGTHASNSYATETPCAEGELVFAYFGMTGDLAAFDTQGETRWSKSLGQQSIQNQFGTGASCVVHEGRLVVPRYSDEEGHLLCLEAGTGKELWKSETRKGTSWATPVIWSNQGVTEVIAAGNGFVAGYDLASGAERWRMTGLDTSFSCSVVADSAGVYVGTASPGSRAPICAIAAGQTGDLTLAKGATSSSAVLWSKTKSGAGMPSPVVVGDRLFFFGSTVVCYEKGTGKELYRQRMPGGTMAAGCPLVLGDRILVVNEKGELWNFAGGAEFAATDSLQVGGDGEVFWATPALAGNLLLVRSSAALYAFRAPVSAGQGARVGQE